MKTNILVHVSYRYIRSCYKGVVKSVCTGMKFEETYIAVHTSIYCDIRFIKVHTRTFLFISVQQDTYWYMPL
jgi:hypothetical protein